MLRTGREGSSCHAHSLQRCFFPPPLQNVGPAERSIYSNGRTTNAPERLVQSVTNVETSVEAPVRRSAVPPVLAVMEEQWQTYKQQLQLGHLLPRVAPTINASDLRYCVTWCAAGVCCSSGWRRTGEYSSVVCDSLAPLGIEASAYSDITLVSQGTLDRVPLINKIAERWPGPKVIAFTITSDRPVEEELHSLTGACASIPNLKVGKRRRGEGLQK